MLCYVAPLVGAWIEIFWVSSALRYSISVAPLVGAWIEIGQKFLMPYSEQVAPLVGAWIEIGKIDLSEPHARSLPSWERGLKLMPYSEQTLTLQSRSPRGSVD